MTAKGTAPDSQPKWLRPIDPLVTASLPIRIDPRLRVDYDAAYRLRCDAEPLLTMVTVFVTSSYDNVLAAEITNDTQHGLHVLVRRDGRRGHLSAVLSRRGGRTPPGNRRARHHLAAGSRFRGFDGARSRPVVGRGAAEDGQRRGRAFLYTSAGGRGVGILDCARHATRGGLQCAARAVAVR